MHRGLTKEHIIDLHILDCAYKMNIPKIRIGSIKLSGLLEDKATFISINS